MSLTDTSETQEPPTATVSMGELCLYFLRLGALGFGGPIALVGYMQRDLVEIGATVAAIGVFLPCYLFVVIPAPYFRQVAKNRQVKAFVDGVTAAATGAIGGAAFVLGRRAIIDIPTALIALVTFALLSLLKRAPEPLVILGAGFIGFIVHRYYA